MSLPNLELQDYLLRARRVVKRPRHNMLKTVDKQYAIDCARRIYGYSKCPAYSIGYEPNNHRKCDEALQLLNYYCYPDFTPARKSISDKHYRDLLEKRKWQDKEQLVDDLMFDMAYRYAIYENDRRKLYVSRYRNKLETAFPHDIPDYLRQWTEFAQNAMVPDSFLPNYVEYAMIRSRIYVGPGEESDDNSTNDGTWLESRTKHLEVVDPKCMYAWQAFTILSKWIEIQPAAELDFLVYIEVMGIPQASLLLEMVSKQEIIEIILKTIGVDEEGYWLGMPIPTREEYEHPFEAN